MTKQIRSIPNSVVGYRKPPKSGQFRKGQSGNPKARKRGEENFITVFKRVAKRRVKVSDNGEVKTLTMMEVVILQNVKAALNGDPAAMNNVLRMSEQGGEFLDTTDPKQLGRPIFLPARMETEELLAFYGANKVKGMPNIRKDEQSDR
jgi:hypothetical protein